VVSAVGFIALASVAAEFGVVMLIYLDQAVANRQRRGAIKNLTDLREAITEGAVLRVRPKAMTVAVIIAALVPLFIGEGPGSEVMQRIAAPPDGRWHDHGAVIVHDCPAGNLPAYAAPKADRTCWGQPYCSYAYLRSLGRAEEPAASRFVRAS
jgi:AcrB/AcrD/AcrF family